MPAKTPGRILAALRAQPELTLVEVAARIGKSVRAVERAVSQLEAKGRLQVFDSKKGRRWQVIDP